MSPTHPIAKRALTWGVVTWVGNAAGCLLGMIPLALPLSIVATVVTLITGIGAMVYGVRARRDTGLGPDAKRNATVGFWLGASHLIIVVLVAIGVFVAWRMNAFPYEF